MPNTLEEPGAEKGTLERRPVEVAMEPRGIRPLLKMRSAALGTTVKRELVCEDAWSVFFRGGFAIRRPLAALRDVSLEAMVSVGILRQRGKSELTQGGWRRGHICIRFGV